MENDKSDLTNITAQIECTIKSIHLPRFIPSLLFIVWRGDSFQGQTKLYRANAQQKVIEESFVFPVQYNDPTEVVFSVNAKSPSGSIFRFGEYKMKIGDSIFNFQPIDVSFTVQSESGDIAVDFTVKRIEIDQLIEDKSLGILLQGPSSIAKYSNEINRIPPSLGVSEANEYWGTDTGIYRLLHDLAVYKNDFSAITEIENLIPLLKEKTDIALRTAALIKNNAKILLNKSPLFVSDDGSMLSGNELKEYQNQKYPLLGVYILKSIQDNEQNPVQGFNINDPILTIGVLLTSLASSLQISDELLLYIMQSALFITIGVAAQFPEKYLCVETIFSNVAKKALMTHLENIVSNLSKYIDQPKRILNRINASKQLMSIYGITENIWNEIEKYIYPTLDYLISESWLFSSKVENIPSETYIEIFPKYDWPYLVAFEKIAANSDKLIKDKKEYSHQLHIHKDVRGVWMKLALLKQASNKNIKEIEKQFADVTLKPSLIDISEFIQHNPNIIQEVQVPQPLPKIPDNFS